MIDTWYYARIRTNQTTAAVADPFSLYHSAVTCSHIVLRCVYSTEILLLILDYEIRAGL